jgi:uncharacterized protein (UPF0303 family)
MAQEMKLSLQSDIEKLKLQEERLRFTKFDEADAWNLGSFLRYSAEHQKLPMVMDIRVGTRPLFYAALPGTSPENAEWVRRKFNSVMRYHKSTYRLGREIELSGNAFDATRGVNLMEHAAAGGGFPIHIIGTGVVGSITVSGIPQREDHNFVVSGLAEFLEIELADLALDKE